MTREEAKSILLNAAWLGTNEGREKIESAVEFLCGEPCSDAISRQAVMRVLDEIGSDFDSPRNAVVSLDEIADAIQDLPNVTPNQRTGHWIDTGWTCQTDETLYGYGCSECGGLSFFRKFDNKILGGKWCHCCGTSMRESEEQA